jgi:citrate lyase beta subunit
MARNTILGASLYVPATHKDLQAIANGTHLNHARSVIFCTEDAVADRDVSHALNNLAKCLASMQNTSERDCFVRVRNQQVMMQVLQMPGAEKLTGFVIPKATRHNFESYFCQVRHTNHLLMPTLETADAFDESEMKKFRQVLDKPLVRERILALRIGGNDLLALLGIRRPANMTIYRTPLGAIIARLVTTFRPYGFSLTAPVFEYLDKQELLDQEVCEDLAHGLVGKTAIHPNQIDAIEKHYRVCENEIAMALRIIDNDAPAVFKMHDAMCEVATHRSWALRLVAQARVFGTRKINDANELHSHSGLKQPTYS